MTDRQRRDDQMDVGDIAFMRGMDAFNAARSVAKQLGYPDYRVPAGAMHKHSEQILLSLAEVDKSDLTARCPVFEVGVGDDHLTEGPEQQHGALRHPDMVIGAVYTDPDGQFYTVVWPLGAKVTGPFQTMNEVRCYLLLALRKHKRGKE